MKWQLIGLACLLCLGGCRAVPDLGGVADINRPPSPTAVELPPTATPTALPPTAVPTPIPTPITMVGELTLQPDKFYIYPVPQLYAGDLATFQVTALVPQPLEPSQVGVHILVNGQLVVQDRLGGTNFAGDTTGIYPWVWDTTTLIGEQTVTVMLDPADLIQIGDEDPTNNVMTYTVNILPAGERPRREAEITWLTRDASYATVHVLDKTAAARDLSQLITLTDEAFGEAIGRMGLTPNRKYDIYFVERIIGQGGYTGNSIVISYNDRSYVGGDLRQVLTHEAVHILDQQFAPRAIPFLREGVAVWAVGGHYKAENLDARAAALRQVGQYIPLAILVDNFYPMQHEIGYLEAGAFIHYLVNEYSWERVSGLYGSMSMEGYDTPSAALDASLQAHLGRTLAQVEQEWVNFLDQQPINPTESNDLQTTIRLFDLIRRYQALYDPTAYFLTAWLPSPMEMRQRNITADVFRHPETEMNLLLENMLVGADAALKAADYQQANVILNSVERVLDSGDVLDPLAQSYQDIIRKATTMGFEVQRIEMNGNEATVYITSSQRLYLTPLQFVRTQNSWVFVN